MSEPWEREEGCYIHQHSWQNTEVPTKPLAAKLGAKTNKLLIDFDQATPQQDQLAHVPCKPVTAIRPLGQCQGRLMPWA